MYQNRNILCISNPTWEGDYAKTIVELMSVATRENNVLYIDYQFTIKDLLFTFLGKAKAPWKRMLGIEKRLRTIELEDGNSVNVLTPPTILTINFLKDGWLYRQLLRYNTELVSSAINKAIHELNMHNDLIVIDAFNPGMGLYNIGKFNENLHLYHCYDEIGAAVWAGNHGADLEKEYMPLVDGVICTSKGLYHSKKDFNKRTFLVQNGVNFKLFSNGFNDNISKATKVIGYIGSIDDRLDYELLQELFTEFSSWEFHFAGRCNYEKGKEILENYNNVKLLGSMPVNKLPSVLSSFHAGLIPFVKNDFTKGIYPLKINEYLAAGIPVILTPFSDLSEFENVASICLTSAEFTTALHKEVTQDTLDKRKHRVEMAQKNSWEGRWQEIEGILEQLEKEKALI